MEPTGAGAHQHSILIIDDDQDTSDALQLLLTLSMDAEMTVAPSGMEAFAMLRQPGVKPCLILLDMHMPGMDGGGFLREKAADLALAHLPVIVVSGSGAEGAALVGVAAFVVKPLDFEQLLELVAKHCANADDAEGTDPQ
jgi:two-component system, chemotaxis family, chemotaxis protein CheY